MRKAEYFACTTPQQPSGAQYFTGEDKDEENRKRAHQKEQREYLFRQMEENKQKKALEKKQDALYDQQRLAITR